MRLHSSLQHENVVKLYAAFQEGDRVVMVQEYVDGGDLFGLLNRYGGRLSERIAVQMVLDPFMRVLQVRAGFCCGGGRCGARIDRGGVLMLENAAAGGG